MAEPFVPKKDPTHDVEPTAGGFDADRNADSEGVSPTEAGEERSDLDAPPFRTPEPGERLSSEELADDSEDADPRA